MANGRFLGLDCELEHRQAECLRRLVGRHVDRDQRCRQRVANRHHAVEDFFLRLRVALVAEVPERVLNLAYVPSLLCPEEQAAIAEAKQFGRPVYERLEPKRPIRRLVLLGPHSPRPLKSSVASGSGPHCRKGRVDILDWIAGLRGCHGERSH